MFCKKFIFLIIPFCLQCGRGKSNKENGSNNNRTRLTNTNPKMKLRVDKKNSTIINDRNNIFSDDIKKLKREKEKLKFVKNGSVDFEKKKKDLKNVIEEKFISRVIATAEKYFIRPTGKYTDFKNDIKEILADSESDDKTDIDKVWNVFSHMISMENKSNFSNEITNIISQYEGALFFIEGDEFDS